MYSHSVDNGHSCSSWFALDLDSTYVYGYQGALLPVELSQRHPLLLFLRKVSKPTTHPDIGATQDVQAAFDLRRTFPLHCLPVTPLESTDCEHTAGRCCPYRGMVQFGLQCGMLYPTSYIMTLPWWKMAIEHKAFYDRKVLVSHAISARMRKYLAFCAS